MQKLSNPQFKASWAGIIINKRSIKDTFLLYLYSGFPLIGAVILLLLPAIFSTFFTRGPVSLLFSLKEILMGFSFFLIPIVFFYRNIKVYLYCMFPLILLSPLFIFAILLYDIRPRFELIALIMQTNPGEIIEAIAGYLGTFLPVTLIYCLLYLYFVKQVTLKKISFKLALPLSLLALLLSFGRIYLEGDYHRKSFSEVKAESLLAVKYYPISLIGGALEAYSYQDGEMNVPEDFSFQAFVKDSIPRRRIFVLMIGESSRYDRWQINGYERETSPRLAKRKNLISYPNVVSGSNQTRMAVPQMITRATPDSIQLIYEEKSILAAFSEVGYKTIWLSNQTDQEIFFSGAINWHAKSADVSVFSPSVSPNFEFDSPYDERLLPALDSLINSTGENLFIVLHTMGSHWNYAKRYPAEFDVFKPSGTTVPISRPTAEKRVAISNSYDNSILYSDYILDSAISIIDQANAISSVTFLSDHGEDLFDANTDRIDYHLSESPITLCVPLFIWTSDLYREVYPQKQQALLENRNRKIGSDNTFYTLLDLANIGILKEDVTKSLANSKFRDSEQKFVGSKVRKGFTYSSLLNR